MTIPNHNEIRMPVLIFLKGHGDQLAECIDYYDLCMQKERVHTMKGMDNDFWDELIDEE